MMKELLSIIFLLLFTIQNGESATITWNGSIDNDWHNDGNWIGGSKPGVGDYALINGGTFVVDISTTEVIQGLRVISGELNVLASGNLTCEAAASPGIWAQGDVMNLGVINILNISHAGIQLTNKTFTNSGTLSINGTSQSGINMTANAIFNNNGTMSINGTTANGLLVGASTCTFNNNASALLNIGNLGSIGARGIFNAGTVTTGSGAIINIDNSSNAALENASGSLLTNDGEIFIGNFIACAHMGIRNYSTFTNNGTVDIDMVSLSRLQNEASSVFNNIGVFISSDGGGANKSINAISTGNFINSGSIEGEGWINGNSANFTNSATVAPGFSPGTQTYQNGYTNTIYDVELATGANDLLVFNSGSSTDYILGGTLNVSNFGGFSPAINQTFLIIDSPMGYTGTFATVNYPSDAAEWEIEYNTTDVTLKYIGVNLPIELLSFNARTVNKEIEIIWSTATEINNHGFELQKSENGKTWRKLAWIDSKGANSMEVQNYKFTDVEPNVGDNYYRLIQYDINGYKSELPVVNTVFLNHQFSFHIFPNPVGDLLTINHNGSEEVVNIRIYTMYGKTVKVEEQASAKVDVSGLAAGQYLIEVVSGVDSNVQMIFKI